MLPVAFVYILTNQHHTVLYTGTTTDLRTRIWEHQKKINPSSFTARYNLNKPVFFKGYSTKEEAREQELFIKGKSRKWKEEIINEMNPDWNDFTNTIMNMNP